MLQAGCPQNTLAHRSSNDDASDDESPQRDVSDTVDVTFAGQSTGQSTVVDGPNDGGSLLVFWKKVHRDFALCLVQEESPPAVPSSSWNLKVPRRAFFKRGTSVTGRPLMSSENSEETIGLANWRQH